MEKVGWMEFGGIIGYIYNYYSYQGSLNLNDVYYLSNTCDIAVGRVSENEYGANKLESLKYSELVQKLNKFIDEWENSDWKKWKLGEKGYPEIE